MEKGSAEWWNERKENFTKFLEEISQKEKLRDNEVLKARIDVLKAYPSVNHLFVAVASIKHMLDDFNSNYEEICKGYNLPTDVLSEYEKDRLRRFLVLFAKPEEA